MAMMHSPLFGGGGGGSTLLSGAHAKSIARQMEHRRLTGGLQPTWAKKLPCLLREVPENGGPGNVGHSAFGSVPVAPIRELSFA
jgi:hypothetical protein